MPELPEVETIKEALSRGIGRARIDDVVVRQGSLRQKVPDDLAAQICGALIHQYRRIAKYIIIDLNNSKSLVWHMGMSGKIKLSDKPPEKPEKNDHIIIATSNGVITYNDPRRFGLLICLPTIELSQHPLFAHIGIDPFDGGLTPQYLFDKLQTKKKTSVKQALLDQSLVAGIGNIYASEILYRARILPQRSSYSISFKECRALSEAICQVLQEAIRAGGSTLRDYQKPDGSFGYFQHQHCVYNKTGQACPDCICNAAKTGGIKKIILGGRSTFYCERIQK